MQQSKMEEDYDYNWDWNPNNLPTTSVSEHFIFAVKPPIQVIREGIDSIENLAAKTHSDKALRAIAAGIERAVEVARKDIHECLEFRPEVGADKFLTTNVSGLVTAGIAWILFHYDYGKDKMKLEIEPELERLMEIAKEYSNRAARSDGIVQTGGATPYDGELENGQSF